MFNLKNYIHAQNVVYLSSSIKRNNIFHQNVFEGEDICIGMNIVYSYTEVLKITGAPKNVLNRRNLKLCLNNSFKLLSIHILIFKVLEICIRNWL